MRTSIKEGMRAQPDLTERMISNALYASFAVGNFLTTNPTARAIRLKTMQALENVKVLIALMTYDVRASLYSFGQREEGDHQESDSNQNA